MVIFTVTRWKKKLLLTLMGVFLVLGISLWLSLTVPSGKLEDDVLSQPVKVQGKAGIIP